MRRVIVILLAGFTLGGSNPAAEMRQDFRQKQFNDQVVRLEGPTPSRYVKREDAGLRISLPRADSPKKPTGFTFQFVLRRDFEVAVGYEVVKDEPPPPGKAVGITAYLMLDSAAQDGVTFGRLQRKEDSPVFTLTHMVKAEGGKRKSKRTEVFPTEKQSATGTLRVTRHGETLTLSAAPGRSEVFVDLATLDAGAEDVKLLRVAADPDGTDTPIEIRVTELRVRADELVHPKRADTRPGSGTRALLLWGVAGGAVLVMAAVVATRIVVRRRRTVPAAPLASPGRTATQGEAV
jgi:hypothetical protein